MNNLFIQAEYAASLSNCKKRKVGCALQIAGEVISIGFNHPASKCNCYMHKENPDVKHAEVHCLEHYDDLSETDAQLAVTYVCCKPCADYIIKKGVKQVWIKEFRKDKMQGVQHLLENNIEVLEWKI